MRCAECGAEAAGKARGWRALVGEEDDGELMVGVFCPGCAEREFGHPQPDPGHAKDQEAQRGGGS